jgi:LPXTG-motif cell wall-anchored protein
MPYQGADPWPSLTLQLLGAVLCVLAALLAFWPRTVQRGERSERGYPFLALALLLVLVASPVVSLGGTRPVLLGIVLTALTVGFLWLERLPLRPGMGIAAMLALALAGALPVASAADGDDPWFDYKAFAERLGPDEPLQFNWGHSYGPITWPRDGSEVLRVAAREPSYWKVATLDDFDGESWVDTGIGRRGFASPDSDLASDWEDRPAWRETLRVTLRRLETTSVIGSGTTLAVEDTGHAIFPTAEPGMLQSDTTFRGGDSYTVRSYFPRPIADDLRESSAGSDTRRIRDLDLVIPIQPDDNAPRGDSAALGERSRLRLRAELRFTPFTPFGQSPVPFAIFPTLSRSNDGDEALRASPFARTWRLSQQLARRSETPYDYVLEVNRYLQDGFSYDEEPLPVPRGTATIDGFLFDTKSGYCQHYSAAMAVLLRMGGIPARVVTGFSPGGFSKRKEAWIVRDTDAHSWVEAWFDDFGWVTLDPTPAATPARSQIAALERPPEDDAGASDAAASASDPTARTGTRPDLLGPQSGPGAGAGAGADEGGIPWWSFVLGGLALAGGGAWWLLRRRRRSEGPAAALDRAVRELEAALRRIGRPASADTTLHQLEQRLGRTPEAAAYLRALRAGRFAATGPPPTSGGRRALRRELAHGSGPRGRLRALWAMPPWRA